MVNSLKGDGKAIFTIFVGAIIAIVFLASVADSIFIQTNTVSASNSTFTAPAVNESVAILGRELVDGTTPVTLNASNSTGTDLQNSGVFVDTRIINGVRTVALNINQTGINFASTDINVTYEYDPQGYISIAGGRSVALLITIISALALLIFAVVVFIKDGSLGALIGRDSVKRRK